MDNNNKPNPDREEQNRNAQNEVTDFGGLWQRDEERVAGWNTDNDGNAIKDRD